MSDVLRAAAPVALYVHVPFCLSACPYCDFVVFSGSAARGPSARIEATVRALAAEIELRAPDHRSPLRSVYIGGGTPSLLSAEQVQRLLAQADASFGIAVGAEVTIEANPGAGERGDLAGFRAAGVNRLSIGAQSLDSGELRRIGRRHDPQDVGATVREARRAGFVNISLDLLYDVPGQTLRSWRTTLHAALALEPEHVSAYALALDDPDAEGLVGPGGDHLPLRTGARRWRERARIEQDEDLAATCYELADELLTAAGFQWYELSNWSLPGFESRHNRTYWSWLPYEAVGPGAHRFDGTLTRGWNAASLDGYLAAVLGEPPCLPPGGRDLLDEPTARAERAMLALRTREGLPAGLSRLPELAAGLAWGRAAWLLEPTGEGGLRLTRAGRLLASEVFRRLLPPSLARAG